ncbi:MAG: GNAT family N-acetyltransferase [Fimbriimonadaceae bacterium]|nr:MAG: GNAT family N-acetyltransferase [Fimbriimonadaceae bacterium]
MIEISRDRKRLDRERIYQWMKESYWADERTQDVIDQSIENSECWSAFEDGVMVGFARVITDRATFAWLCDVYVGEEFRGRGVSTALMDAIMACEDYASVRWMLGTRDAHGLYEKYGFETSTVQDRWMTKGFRNRFPNDC